MTRALLALAAAWSLAFAAPVAAQAPDPLFAASEPIHLTITAPLPGLMRDRTSKQSVSGTLTDPAGQPLAVNLRLRGITRRAKATCDFPPLRVDFTAPPTATSLFAGQKKLKLVTHCRNSRDFDQYVLLEYAAYRMYNVLTPHSFRVRLANIDYRNSDGSPITSRVGFFLEDIDDVASRNGVAEARAGPRIPRDFLIPIDAARYALFQHMIANHDWSMTAGPAGDECCHNARLIGALAPAGAMPVPYDFDYSGLVDAPYAAPPDALSINHVTQRVYRGYCIHNAEAYAAAREMRAAQPRLLGLLGQVPGLSARKQQSAGAFLARFFADIATDADVGAKVLRSCVG
jgi:hypothetical protein